jgi:hypothetical protein
VLSGTKSRANVFWLVGMVVQLPFSVSVSAVLDATVSACPTPDGPPMIVTVWPT